MKRLICAMLVTVFFISSIPAFTLAEGSEAQALQFRTVWENPYTLTTYHPGNEVNSTFYTFPKVIWNGSQYVDCLFNSSDMSAGIGSVYIKVWPDHTVFYDPYQTEERIKAEAWIAEHYNASNSTWETEKPVGESVHSLVNSSGIYFDRTTTFGSGTTLDEWYWLRIGSKMKISVVFNPRQSGEYRLAWVLTGVSGTKAKWLNGTENVTAQVVDDRSCSRVQFTSHNESKCLVDWSDARFFNGTAGKWVTSFNGFELQKGVSDSRCHARISFGNFSLTSGQPLVLDPTIETFNSSDVLDGFIEHYGPTYPPQGGTSINTAADSTCVGQIGKDYGGLNYHQVRGYLSFDTSSIPAMSYNISATLKLRTHLLDSNVNFTVQVWGGNQPICNGNLTIMDGTQPIYNNNLTADSWGTGKVQVASWDTVNYQDGIYINLTIPPDQVNKVNSTEFELKSSMEGTTPGPVSQTVYFYSGDSEGNEPKLEVSYCLDTVTIGTLPHRPVTWFYRNVSTDRVAIVLFGAYSHYLYLPDEEWVRSIDLIHSEVPEDVPEKGVVKIRFLDTLIQNGFSILTVKNDSGCSGLTGAPPEYVAFYCSSSTWVQDATMWLMDNQGYRHIFLFGFSGGGVVVGNEIQKDYATRFSAAVMTCAPVDWTGSSIYRSARTASNTKVATCFPEPVNDQWYNPYTSHIDNFTDMTREYYNNSLSDKEWHSWDGGHDFFNKSCLDHPGENASTVVINWLNEAHSPNVPFTPSGPQTVFFHNRLNYSSGTFDSDGENVTYQFDWGDGTSDTLESCISGLNVTCSHWWNALGTFNVTVRAKDASSAWSCWSQPITVTVILDDDGSGGDAGNDFNSATLYNAAFSTGTLRQTDFNERRLLQVLRKFWRHDND